MRRKAGGQRIIQRQTDGIADAPSGIGREKKAAPLFAVRRAPNGAAHLFSAAQKFESVSLHRRKGGRDVCRFIIFTKAGENADLFADMPLHRNGMQRGIFSESVPRRIAAAVVGAFQAGKIRCQLLRGRAAENILIIPHHRTNVCGRAHSSFDLKRNNARGGKLFRPFSHAQIGEGEPIAKRFAARPIRRIPFAARLLAQTAVSAVAARKRREIALPRKAGTQRALHKNFRFDLLADGGDLRKRRFPRENDARKPACFCLPRAVCVAYARLRRKMQHHLRALPFELLSEEQLLHDQRVGARVPRLFRALEKGGELPLFDERVERHIHAHTEQMRAADELFEPFRRKIGGVCARGKTAHAEVYSIRPRIQRGKKRRFVARRRKDLTHDTIVPSFAAFEKGFTAKI